MSITGGLFDEGRKHSRKLGVSSSFWWLFVPNGQKREREREGAGEEEKKHVTRTTLGLTALNSLVEVTHSSDTTLKASSWDFSWNTLHESPWWSSIMLYLHPKRGDLAISINHLGIPSRQQSLGYVAHLETRCVHNFPFTSRSSYWCTTPSEHGLFFSRLCKKPVVLIIFPQMGTC